MPELPEVETVRAGLAKHLQGKIIRHVTIRQRKLRIPIPAGLKHSITGQKICNIARRAKYLLFHLGNDTTLILHLGMSGSLVLHNSKPASPGLHDHVVFELSGNYWLVFRDPRRFGVMTCCSTHEEQQHPLLSHLGHEPLARSWNAEKLYHDLQHTKAPIKATIMDQRLVVGVGNIYACEALFRSGLRPDRPSNHVNKAEAAKLYASIKSVLKEAIASGGSTLRDYVRSSGDSGYFQHHFNVYARQKMPCYTCNTPIVSLRQSGRSSFYCPHCQH